MIEPEYKWKWHTGPTTSGGITVTGSDVALSTEVTDICATAIVTDEILSQLPDKPSMVAMIKRKLAEELADQILASNLLEIESERDELGAITRLKARLLISKPNNNNKDTLFTYGTTFTCT